MPNNRPISDLQNYKDVLREVKADAPVLLTEDGHAKYVILCIQDYEQMQLAFSTYDKLQEAEQEARSTKVRYPDLVPSIVLRKKFSRLVSAGYPTETVVS